MKILLEGPDRAEIRRGRNGELRVRAETPTGLYRGFGYCHGLDRGLQLLMLRILGHGRAAELLAGDDRMVAIDTFFRRMNFSAGTHAEIMRVDPKVVPLALAYVDGINAALMRRWPWELRLLKVPPEPWRLGDSLMLSRMIAYVSLAETQGQLERLIVEMAQAGVDAAHLEALFPGQLAGLDLDLLKKIRLGARMVPADLAWTVGVPKFVASNNWVIAGRRTRSGAPILANDPHLEVNTLPCVWQEIVLELGDRYAMGATMPGLPAILIGRNRDLAWGVTYSFMDAMDSWIEDCRDGAGRRVVEGRETWEPFEVRRETIRRKGGAPVTLDVHENRHGVLDGDPSVPGLYLATRWASLAGTGARSIEAMISLFDLATVEDGRAALGRLESAWNWVLADRQGHIGYQMSGRLPIRRPGATGLLPLPGWDPANDWQGFAPAEDLPRDLDPAAGFFTTANHDLNRLGRRVAQTAPMGRWRADRIEALLAARSDWTVEDVRRMQMDVHSTEAAAFCALLLPVLDPSRHGPAVDILKGWDFGYGPESRGAWLFERFYEALIHEVFGRGLGAPVVTHLLRETAIFADFYLQFQRVLLGDPDASGPWLGGRPRREIYAAAADRAFQGLAAGDVRTWGSTRQLMQRHMLFGGKLPAWLGFDRGPLVLRGGRASIHQGQIYRSGGRDTSFAPSYRMVVDLGQPGIHSALAGGPSDRRFSPWYASEVGAWLVGNLKHLEPEA